MRSRRQNQRGVGLVAVAVFMSALFALTVVGIDIGRLAHVATEVQSAADAAAAAGALGLRDSGGQSGTGIARAHVVSSLNFMNGAAALNGDVFVDEGFYDNSTGNFECCTSNTPCCSSGQWVYQHCGGVQAPHNCNKRSAVLAMPQTVVTNLFAGIFDFFNAGRITAAAAAGRPNATSTVQKLAIAEYGGPATGCTAPPQCTDPNNWQCFCQHGVAPCLPLSAPSCDFPSDCVGSSCTLPALVATPGGGTAYWTGFQSGHSDSILRGFMDQPPTCNQPGNPNIPGTQTVTGNNDWLDVTNGANTPAFNAAQCAFNNRLGCSLDANGNITAGGPSDGRVFTIPIFDWTSCSSPATGHQTIAGFATVRITNVIVNGSTKEVDVQTLSANHTVRESVGGDCFGTDCRVVLAH